MDLHKFFQISFINYLKKVSRAKVTTGAKYGTCEKLNVLCKNKVIKK